MNMNLPGIVITGASGFIGRNFLEAASDKYRLFCLARRSQREAGIPKNDNISWTQVDVSIWDTLRQVVEEVKENGGADYVLHLAAYYDFSQTENPEYERTNILGTRNILKLAQQIGTRRFIFVSSVAACEFPPKGQALNEDSPADATFPYARSKRAGEDLLKDYIEWFPCTTVRLGAVFSDWCEYPPLYMFLETWLSRQWNARIIGGRGQSAVPYIHTYDLNRLFLSIIERGDALPRLSTYIASPNYPVSHIELFKTATRYYLGQDINPIRVPRAFALVGVALRAAVRRMLGRDPMERVWMTKYIDRQLTVDASRTHRELDWEPRARYSLLRRLLFIIERMKNHPEAWQLRNQLVVRRVAERPNLAIYNAMVQSREDLINEIIQGVQEPGQSLRFAKHQQMDGNVFRWYVTLVYQLAATSVRTRDRTLVRKYSQIIAYRRFVEGFDVKEVCDVMTAIGEIIASALRSRLDLKGIEQRIHDHITMTFQLAVDEIEDSYELFQSRSPEFLQQIKALPVAAVTGDLEMIVQELEDVSQDALEERLSAECRELREKSLL